MYQNFASENSLSRSASTHMSTKNDINKNYQQNSVTKNILRLSERDILKNLCLNGVAKIPISKPPACVCRHCIYVDNLPIEQSAVSYRLTSNTNFQHSYHNHQSLDSDIIFFESSCF